MTHPGLPPGEPVLAGPMPKDPKSIDVWPTILATTRVWAGLAFPLFLLFAAFIVPVMALFALSAPNLAGAMLGRPPADFDLREFYGLGGTLLLGMTTGGLATIAVLRIADRALAGEPAPGIGEALGQAIERVPAVFATYLLIMLLLTAPIALLVLVLAVFVPQGSEPAGPMAVAGFLFGFALVFPAALYAGMVLRFAPVLAALRESGPLFSLGESVRLVRGRFWRALGFVMLVGVLVQAGLTGALSVAFMLYVIHPVAGCVAYALAIALCLPFQLLQEVALLRRLEAAHARDREDAPRDASPDEPVEEPPAT